jgi:hypothetical protein
MTPPPAFLAVALKTWVLPTSMEKDELGLKVMLDTPPAAGLLLLLPRQPGRKMTSATANVRRRPGPQRCMNPLVQVFKFQSFKVSKFNIRGGLGSDFEFRVASFFVHQHVDMLRESRATENLETFQALKLSNLGAFESWSFRILEPCLFKMR